MSSRTKEQCYHETRYEETRLACEQLTSCDDDDDVEIVAAQLEHLLAIQCAALQSKGVERAAAHHLWMQTVFDIDRQAASTDHAKNDGLALPASTINNPKETIDEFFERFPDCVREGWDQINDDDSSLESSDDEIQVQKVVSARSTLACKSDIQLVPTNNPLQSAAKKQETRRLPSAVANPYMKQAPARPVQKLCSQPHVHRTVGGSQNFDSSSSHCVDSGWDDFEAKSSGSHRPNDFQTAREFYSATGGEDQRQQHQHGRGSKQTSHHRYQQPSSNQYSLDYNPSSMHHHQQRQQATHQTHLHTMRQIPHQQQESSSPPPPKRLEIRDSLKRKFQPPKRTTNGGQGVKQKKSDHAPTQSKKKDNEDDDEELPEELQGLDKELVKKIQHEIMECGETVTFHDIAGLEDAKQTVQELVCWPMKRPDLFTGLRRGPNGLLLFGPPGTGKTLIGKAIAHESGATFFAISSSSLTSKWIGEGEKLVRTLFAVAVYREPAVVFLDEVDSLLTQRKSDENEASRRIKTEFLVQLDGTASKKNGVDARVLVIGATNRPHELDDAARRRFVKRLYIPLPTEADRRVLLLTLLSKNQHKLGDTDVNKLARDTDGYSGADLKALCVDAAMGPLRELGPSALDIRPEDVPPIAYKHFRRAMRGMNPSVAQADLEIYVEWNRAYGSKRASSLDETDDEEDEEGTR